MTYRDYTNIELSSIGASMLLRHDPGYDFNDELLIWGPAAFAAIAEKALPKS
jgi:hypothetical protein